MIRFQQYGDDDFVGGTDGVEDGLFIDDISVKPTEISYVTPPFLDVILSRNLPNTAPNDDPS